MDDGFRAIQLKEVLVASSFRAVFHLPLSYVFSIAWLVMLSTALASCCIFKNSLQLICVFCESYVE